MIPISNQAGEKVFLLSGDQAMISEVLSAAQGGESAIWSDVRESSSCTTTSSSSSTPSSSPRNIREEARPRVQLGLDLFAGEREINEYKMHVINLGPPDGGDSSDPGVLSSASSLASPPDVIGKLIAEIEHYRALSPLMIDLRGIHRKIVAHCRALRIPHDAALHSLHLPTVEDFIAHGCGPQVLCNALCDWPTIVVTSREGASKILPLHPTYDVCHLIKAFRCELDDLLLKNPHESHSDFSLFSALFAFQLVAEKSPWAPHYLGSPDRERDTEDTIKKVGVEILNDAFCVVQLLRFVTIMLKSGFECIVRDAQTYYGALQRIYEHYKALSICQQMGVRLSYSSIKYAAMLMFAISGDPDGPVIHNRDLIRLTQYQRLKCDVKDCYPFEHCLHPIRKLSDYVQEVLQETPLIVDDTPHNELSSAFERLRDVAIAVEHEHSLWFAFNTHLYFFNGLVKQTLKGELSRKNLSLVWNLSECKDPNTHWVAMFSAGFAFPVELPKNTLEALDAKGDIVCDPSGMDQEMCTYIVHVMNQELSWEPVQRLKDLFRMKNCWTKLELYAWLDKCLQNATSPAVDDLIVRYLRAVPGTPNAHENVTLHVEKFDPL